MQIKRYEVKNLQDALLKIKKDLGPDAIILSTKTIKHTEPAMMEVIAAVDPGERAPVRINSLKNPEKAGTMIHDHLDTGIEGLSREIREVKEMIAGLNTNDDVRGVLSDLKAGMEVMFDIIGPAKVNREGERFARLYRTLTGNGMSRTRVCRIIDAVLKETSNMAVEDDDQFLGIAEKIVEHSLAECGTKKRPARIRAFIGPTGVGKTTTLAKLAARAAMDEKLKVGLMTTDNFRIAAVEQLKVYANIMGLPLQVASEKDGFKRGLQAMSGMDVIFVDTPGKAPSDMAYLSELKDMFSLIPSVEVSLLLNPSLSKENLLETERRFRVIGYDQMILTKLDECSQYGSLFDVIEQAGKPVRYITNGQNVPQDIQESSPSRLASLIVGNSLH